MFRVPTGPLFWGLVFLAFAGCRDDEPSGAPPEDPGEGTDTGGTDGGTGTETGGGEGTDTGSGSPQDAVLQDRCDDARTVGAGRWQGTLLGHRSSEGGACGLEGPDAFVRVVVPTRSDLRVEAWADHFVPRVGVLEGPCTPNWSARGRLCTRGLPGWVPDLPAGTELHVSVGADPEDPVLDLDPEEVGDRLGVALGVTFRPILAQGADCSSGKGRCEAGTICAEAGGAMGEDPGGDAPPGEPRRCLVVPGDTCGRAVEVEIGEQPTVLAVDPNVPYGDAYAHGCGGARRPDAVFRLLPRGIPNPAVLRVEVDRPGIGLAVRAPSCAAADERGCAAAVDGVNRLELPLQTGIAPYLFVELPVGADAAEEPVELSISLSEP